MKFAKIVFWIAGPGGLTLANDLAVRSISFHVIDPLPEPRGTTALLLPGRNWP